MEFKLLSLRDLMSLPAETGEEGYKRGYRDGFIAAQQSVYDLWFLGKERSADILFNFWQRELWQWEGKHGFIMPPRCEVMCVYCKKRKAEHLDHVVPKSKGGASDSNNLVPACARCNISKHARTPEEWRQSKHNNI